jgi:hypothetical protein
MKKLISAAVLATGLLVSPYAEAASAQRTDELLWQCTGQDGGNLGKLACGKFLDGMMDMHSIFVGMDMGGFYCLPASGISADQAIRIFISWADNNPKELHKSARLSAVVSLREAFPCPK